MNMTQQIGHGYAYELEDGSLCCWAEPTLEKLTKPKPSPGARKVAVILVKRSDWIKLQKGMR